MTFSNKTKYLSFDYTILSESVPRVTAVKDLGGTLTSNLNFRDHISRNVSKALRFVDLLSAFAQHLPMYRLYDPCIYL